MTTPGAKPRVLSGMQPSGRMHLGNLSGALENWRRLQDTHDAYYLIADWHALATNYAETGEIRVHVREMLLDWLSAGLDPARCTIFQQSHVPEHAVLYLLFSMITPVPWLERNPTYKEQQQALAERDLTTHGFLGYPVLQAADILLYKAQVVPVGIDQLPHIELTRELARRFNHLYREVFPVPESLLTTSPKVIGTDGRKMSKSYGNGLYLAEPAQATREKVLTMMTDPARKRRADPGNPEVCPVYALHKIYTASESVARIDRDCRTAAIGCVDCKGLLLDGLEVVLGPMRERRAVLTRQPGLVEDVLADGDRRARAVAQQTLSEAQEAMRL